MSQDKLRSSGCKTKRETTLIAGHGNKDGNSRFKKVKKDKKCCTKGCETSVTRFLF